MAQVRVHDHADGAFVADGRDATDDEAGHGIRFTGARAPQARLADAGGQEADVDAVDAAHQSHHRLQAAIVSGCREDERLDDLAELGADGLGGVLCRMRRLREGQDLDLHALAARRLADTAMRGVIGLGHGRESSTRPARDRLR